MLKISFQSDGEASARTPRRSRDLFTLTALIDKDPMRATGERPHQVIPSIISATAHTGPLYLKKRPREWHRLCTLRAALAEYTGELITRSWGARFGECETRRVTEIPKSVAIAVALIGVRDEGTTVDPIGDAVEILIALLIHNAATLITEIASGAGGVTFCTA